MEFVNINNNSSTVNFEDLFDFSPEPPSAHQPELSSAFESPIYQIPLLSPHLHSQGSNPGSVLSSSLPSTWKDFHPRSSSSSGGVKDLLEDLPEVLTESASSSFREESLLGTSAPPTQVRSKRGRKPGQKNLKTDMKSKLERSRQSARECRARKKLRYQYLDDLILEREKANISLREELYHYQKWCHEIDKGNFPEELKEFLRREASS
eukprot:TRINITY_DN1229_c0_g1_i1.p1 TRINITY_DN1229_c0_g1~~TRINITY_DN1229_c0_g1_i1.p1  ORF type:complete len:208 (-),score=73.96 TRINITY_DN1229_c0_g1_i1:943-1566(-)